jgi:hypothetical protein
LSFRQIGVYIKSLMRKPGKSTLLMAIDETTAWSIESYLMARISDAQELSNYLFIQANSAENAEEMPLPTPVQRPGDKEEVAQEKPKPEEFASGQEVAAFFNRMNSL